jgi:hypothetical protein
MPDEKLIFLIQAKVLPDHRAELLRALRETLPLTRAEACIAHLLLDNVMRSDPLFFWERSLYDAFLTFRFRIDGFSRRTRLINADAILLETLNRLCVSVFRFETLRPDQKSIGVNNP